MNILKKEIFSLFWVLLGILFLRTFVFEPFQIPTGSMIPTLLVGDHLLVSKSAYDLKVPFTGKSLLKISDPQAGDVVVFEYPNVEKAKNKDGIYYIKRIIGIPGDRISVNHLSISINGKPLQYTELSASGVTKISGEGAQLDDRRSRIQEEKLSNRNHSYLTQNYPGLDEKSKLDLLKFKRDYKSDCAQAGTFYNDRSFSFFRSTFSRHICEFQVPDNYVFVMGDNRDDSEDSRYWGLVPRVALRGKALRIFMSLKGLDPDSSSFNWNRFGLKIR